MTTPTEPIPLPEGSITDNLLHLPRLTTPIPLPDIRVIAGEGGVSLNGGEILIWKKTHIITPSRRYSVALPPPYSERFYTKLLENCPHAVGMPYKGQLHLPECPPRQDPADFLASALTLSRRELRRQSLLAIACALLSLLIAVAITALVFYLSSQLDAKDLSSSGGRLYKLGIFAIVAFVIAGLFLIRALFQRAHAARITKTLRALTIP